MIMDGNFTAQHRKMKNPEDDVRFADGHGFMVEDAPYREHLKTAFRRRQVRILRIRDHPDTVSQWREQQLTCHDHRAILSASAVRPGLESTGIGAVACSRHGFFYPRSVVNFEKGEGYVEFEPTTPYECTDNN